MLSLSKLLLVSVLKLCIVQSLPYKVLETFTSTDFLCGKNSYGYWFAKRSPSVEAWYIEQFCLLFPAFIKTNFFRKIGIQKHYLKRGSLFRLIAAIHAFRVQSFLERVSKIFPTFHFARITRIIARIPRRRRGVTRSCYSKRAKHLSNLLFFRWKKLIKNQKFFLSTKWETLKSFIQQNRLIKGMLRRNIEHFLKKCIYEKLGF